MKKQMVTRLLSVIAAGTVLTMALISAFVLNQSNAWFSQRRTIGADAFGLSVGDYEDAQLIAHPISELDESTQTYTVVSDVESYVLPTYDPDGITYSKYERALAIFITFTCNEATTVHVSLAWSTPDVIIEHENYISNCIEVAPATWDETARTATVSGEFISPVTVTDTICEKEAAGKLSLETRQIEAGSTTLCYIMMYNVDFLNYLNSKSSGGSNTQIVFSNDISFSVQ